MNILVTGGAGLGLSFPRRRESISKIVSATGGVLLHTAKVLHY